jgi:hypothetical protein
MNAHPMLPALLLALPLLAQAQGSLAERRLAITQGTAPGKVLIEAPAPRSAASAASGAAPTAAASAPARGGLFSRLPPPSGRPLNAAQRLNAPDQGIVIQPATAAASAAR